MVRTPAAAGAREYQLSLRAVRQHVDGVSWTAGYMASLVERAPSVVPPNVHVLPSTTADSLVVFSLAESLEAIVSAASRRAARLIRLEPSKGELSMVGHRGDLGRALEHFLTEAAKVARAGSSPVVAARERGRRIDLTILDLDLGIPAAALEKVLIAPSAAPRGLEAFASLVTAVQASLGQIKVRAPDGWGTRFTLEFIRAHRKPADSPANDASVIEISKWPQDA
jgi:signal transduction histidine kinase